MNPILSTEKNKLIIYSSYTVLALFILLVLYLIISNVRMANLVDENKVQIHTTQLDLARFNKVLNQVTEQTK